MDNHSASIGDSVLLAAAASEFASFPGHLTDAAVKEFLDRFPLPLIFIALKDGFNVPGLEGSLVSCLERILETSYGVSLLPQCVPYAQAGLKADSPLTRQLSCKAISQLLENSDKDEGVSVQVIVEHGVWPSIVACLADSDESVATAAAEAVKNLAKSTHGLELIFPAKAEEGTLLKEFAMSSSSMVRIRILAIIAALFGISDEAATAVHRSGLLGMFEQELNSTTDMLATLNVLEVLYEIVTTPIAAKFLLTKSLLQRLAATISNSAVDSLLRSRSITISARLLSSDGIYSAVDEFDVKNAVQAIDLDLERLKATDSNEREIALDALGQIGTVMRGAEFLLCNTPPTARHAVDATCFRGWRNIQLAGTHALASISGQERGESTQLLNGQAETCLRNLIYAAAENSSKHSPSGLLWSLLQQDPEIRLAAYRLITGLVTRQWCLWEVCAKQEIINLVTDPHSESTKIGMEFRHSCCVAISHALLSSSFKNDPAFSDVSEKLQAAVRRGPYLAKEFVAPKPQVATEERY